MNGRANLPINTDIKKAREQEAATLQMEIDALEAWIYSHKYNDTLFEEKVRELNAKCVKLATINNEKLNVSLV